ncbi:MAG: isoprenyl transferase [Clostridia bacterium]
MKEGFAKSAGLEGFVPKHVAIIMDGNGRFAKKRGESRASGHRAGMERLHSIVETSSDLGISALTLYAFSTENWKRPKHEIQALMGLLIEFFAKEIDELYEKGVCVHVLGETDAFPKDVQNSINSAIQRTKDNSGLKLCLALNYGSRAEIVRAVKQIVLDVENGILKAEDIDENAVMSRLYTKDLPELDLMIRTSGEERLSNFLLYQCAYSEFLFVPELWPEFTAERYIDALLQYKKRDRRFGGI